MIDLELRSAIEGIAPNAVLFDSPSFDGSIIGTTDDGGVAYNYEQMVEELMLDGEMSYEDAEEFIDYNTIRSIPYVSDGVRPQIIYNIWK